MGTPFPLRSPWFHGNLLGQSIAFSKSAHLSGTLQRPFGRIGAPAEGHSAPWRTAPRSPILVRKAIWGPIVMGYGPKWDLKMDGNKWGPNGTSSCWGMCHIWDLDPKNSQNGIGFCLLASRTNLRVAFGELKSWLFFEAQGDGHT